MSKKPKKTGKKTDVPEQPQRNVYLELAGVMDFTDFPFE
jgi:hypothetical protein